MIQIGWIDFSPTHRDKVGAALDLLRPEGMVDELGLGSTRDGMANQLFPGISTIQTRAKYFFIIPYILYEFQQLLTKGQARGKVPSKYLEQREYEIMWQLGDYYNHQDNFGVIGVTRRKPQKIVRRPSAIYWNGINTYKFINANGLSSEIFLKRAVKGDFESLLSAISDTDETKDDVDADHENIFCLKVRPPNDWTNNLNLDLSHDEGDFFYHQILSVAKGKLLPLLLVDQNIWSTFYASDNFMQFAMATQNILPQGHVTDEIILAHDFSELMYGAHITYNCLLQKRAFGNEEQESEWEEWIEALPETMLRFERFDIDRLLSYTLHPKKATVQFIKNWWELVNTSSIDINTRNTLVQDQEFNVKKVKARLKYKKFEEIKEGSWVGLKHFDYRFRIVRTIINDINKGLAR
jgi:hypothetical protein